jgi:hypothetical protein
MRDDELTQETQQMIRRQIVERDEAKKEDHFMKMSLTQSTAPQVSTFGKLSYKPQNGQLLPNLYLLPDS